MLSAADSQPVVPAHSETLVKPHAAKHRTLSIRSPHCTAVVCHDEQCNIKSICFTCAEAKVYVFRPIRSCIRLSVSLDFSKSYERILMGFCGRVGPIG